MDSKDKMLESIEENSQKIKMMESHSDRIKKLENNFKEFEEAFEKY